MREIRIFQAGNYSVGQLVELSPEASQHVGKVLRMVPEDIITLFAGDDKEYQAVIVEVRKKCVIVQIDAMQTQSRESSLALHLAQAISKGDKMEWVVQKAVELGVASIRPIISDRCVVKRDEERMAKKIQQWQAIAVSACEQSGRNKVPQILPAQTFSQYIKNVSPSLKFILYPEGQKSWRDYTYNETDISLLIGPEGGLTPDEIHEAMSQGFSPLTLGPRVLRTETAAITALSILQAVAGDL